MLKKRRVDSFKLFSIISLISLLFVSACSEDIQYQSNEQLSRPSTFEPPKIIQSKNNYRIIQSEWNASTETLIVNGTANKNGEKISVIDTNTSTILGSTITGVDLNWQLNIQRPQNISCTIQTESESGSQIATVKNAPGNCNSSGLSRTVIPSNAVVFPKAEIDSPKTDLIISLNDSVNFIADADHVVGAVAYAWRFSGASENSNVQNPGKIKFSESGVYRISLNVTDSQGLSDPTPAMRTITVLDSTAILTAPPLANIDTPVGDQQIMIGDTLNFSGSGSDPASNEMVTFMWDFAGNSENSVLQNPGDITFMAAGKFKIVLTVSDSLGNLSTSKIKVDVIDPSITNTPPVGMIRTPKADLTISPGDSIYIQGSATDAEENLPISFYWEFDGVTADSGRQNPGMVTFPDAGTYTIRMTATDNTGAVDPNPPTRIITVQSLTPISSDLPTGEILTPLMNTTIMAGESIDFTATGTAAAGNDPLMFIWNLNGLGPNIIAQDAGLINFPDPGVYTITLIVRDIVNQIDPTPDTRIITVEDPGMGGTPPPTNSMPMVSHIIMPSIDLTINPGEMVSFTGFVEPETNPPYTYLWLFDGAAPNSTNLIAGEVPFPMSGIFNVMFIAIDADGRFDSSPAMRTITVNDPMVSMEPIAEIITPMGDQTITVGDALVFEGNAIDVAGNNTLEYLWSFNGGAPNDTMLVTPPITFDIAGVYQVEFSVTDVTTGLTNTNPTMITITVNDAVTLPAPPIGMEPTAQIITPVDDVTINVGESVIFEGMAIDISGNNSLSYLWTFSGGAAENTSMSPGEIFFDTAGDFDVEFTVTDTSTGLDNVMGASLSVNVMPIINPAAPIASITSPAGDITITEGDTLNFNGSAIDTSGNGMLSYLWTFSSMTADNNTLMPGEVTFNSIGSFIVEFTVTDDSTGLTNSLPTFVIVEVLPADGGGGQLPVPIPLPQLPIPANFPDSIIMMPAGDMTITVGSTIEFAGMGTNPMDNGSLNFNWDFDNGNASTAQNPGNVTFNQVGEFEVSLTVNRDMVDFDPSPATVTIIVIADNPAPIQPPVAP